MCIDQKHFFAITLVTVSFISSSVFVSAQTPPSSNPPVISAVAVGSITESSAIISWTTNVPATSRIDYGPTSNYEIPSVIDVGLWFSHQIPLTNLDSGATYHYRVRSTDASGQEQVTTDSTFTIKPPLDFKPPDEIVSLQVASATVTSLLLVWIATGDDGSIGTSTSYEIRASYTTIPQIGALQWWNNAMVLNNTLTPKGPGSQESYTAQNLATSTTYYFAVRARDKGGNISPISISDIKSGATRAAPAWILTATTTSQATTSLPMVPTPTPSQTPTSLPLASSTQQIVSPSTTSPSTSVIFTANLFFGMRNEQVRALQRFLIAQGFLKRGNDTGFFGSMTQRAVQKFQCAQKIVCSGSPGTSGYGFVGPNTRAKLNVGKTLSNT